MGGFGSGNRMQSRSRPLCEQMRRIDVRYMQNTRLLMAGTHGTLRWRWGDEPSGSVQYKMHESAMELIYRFRRDDEDWQDARERITLEKRPQPFGGERTYFLCPRCNRRCMVLYGGLRFLCRKCHGAGYMSQSEDAIDRLRRKAEKLRTRLGDSQGIDWPLPDKPKGMHWRTYLAARQAILMAESNHDRLLERRWRQISGLLGE